MTNSNENFHPTIKLEELNEIQLRQLAQRAIKGEVFLSTHLEPGEPIDTAFPEFLAQGNRYKLEVQRMIRDQQLGCLYGEVSEKTRSLNSVPQILGYKLMSYTDLLKLLAFMSEDSEAETEAEKAEG